MRNAQRWALPPSDPRPDLARVMERVREVIAEIEPFDSPERFRGLGVDVIFGEGRFVGARRVRGRRPPPHREDASSSRPARGPRCRRSRASTHVPYLTNETVFDLREPVPSLIVVGSGPIGMRARAGVPAPGQRGHGRRHGAGLAAARGSRPRGGRSRGNWRPKAFAFTSTRRSRVAGQRGRDRRSPLRGKDGAEQTLHGDRTCWSPPAGGSTPKGLGLDAAGVAHRPGPHRRRRPAAHDQSARLRRRRRRRRLPVHAPGRASRGHRAAPRDLQAVVGEAVARCFRGARTPTRSSRASGCRKRRRRQRSVAHRVYRFPFDGNRPRARRRRNGRLREDHHRSQGQAPGRGDRRSARGRADRRVRARADARGMNAKDISGVIHTYPTLASISRRVADQRHEGRPDADREDVDQAHLPAAGRVRWPTASSDQPAEAASVDQDRAARASSSAAVVAFFALGRPALPDARHDQGEPRRAAPLHRGALRRRARHRLLRLRRRGRVQPAGRRSSCR